MKIIESREVYKCKLFRVTEDKAVDPKTGFEINRSVVRHNGSAVVLAVHRRSILLVRQYRLPAEKSLWELPAGKVDEGETPMAAAKRELAEETGYRAGRWRKLREFYPSPGLLTEVRTIVGAPASPQAGPMFRIAVNNELELNAEVPSVHLPKLNPGATVRITRDNEPDLIGRVRLVSPQIDRATQLGHVRISLTNNPSLKVGMFARANIDAKRSCGVAVPRTAIDHLTVQVIKGNTVETRKVQVGLTSDTNTQILEGLDAGETVVADAGSSLHDGDLVKAMFADELDRRAR